MRGSQTVDRLNSPDTVSRQTVPVVELPSPYLIDSVEPGTFFDVLDLEGSYLV